MSGHVRTGARPDSLDVLLGDLFVPGPFATSGAVSTTVHLHATNRDVHDHAIRCKPTRCGLDVHHLLSAHVGTESSFCHDIICNTKCDSIGDDTGISMCNIREGPCVDEGGVLFNGLDDIREECFSE